MNHPVPSVSIGVPVFNGEATLRRALDSLLGQTFDDFEVIISDNASTDGTVTICGEYAARDSRIRYIRQPINLGAAPNYKVLLDQARGRYFLWAAADDVRSPDFLAENVAFLETHADFVASTSPNRLEGPDSTGADRVTFAIEGGIEDRFRTFFEKCWVSHGIFYSVIRTDVLRECELIGQTFLGADWAIDIYLASRGAIHRTERGLMVSGIKGISNGPNAWRSFRTSPIGWVLPFYRVSLYAMKLSAGFALRPRLALVHRLLQLNLSAAYRQFHSEFYAFYCAYVRPRRRPAGGGLGE